MQIHVVTPENYWPLPWYLRRFDHVGYWPSAAAWANDVPATAPPAVIILTPDVQAAVDSRLRAAYNKQMLFGLRPGVLVAVYVREELWKECTRCPPAPTKR
jgi:predicted membrane-bound mannosyltransferase